MKKTIVLLSLVLCMVLAGCGQNQTEDVTAPTASPEVQAEEPAGEETVAPIEETKPADNKPVQNTEVKKPEAKPQVKEEPVKETPAPTKAPEKTSVTTGVPTVYWCMDTYYHITGCEDITGEVAEISWDVVKQIGLRQCPTCKPPKYENYVENK